MLFSTSQDLKAREADETRRTELFGPAPVNPFADLRSSSGMSLGELAQYAGIDERALSRLEDGLYTTPLPSVLTYWVHLGWNDADITTLYEFFQQQQRRRHKHYFGPTLSSYTPHQVEHPFRILRQRRPSLITEDPLPVGLLECSRAMCVPLDTIQFFEKKWKIQQSVPKTIKSALYQMSYSVKEIAYFESLYKVWRTTHEKPAFQ